MRPLGLYIMMLVMMDWGNSFGQVYQSTLGTVNEWYQWQYFEFGFSNTEIYRTTKDTVINSYNYKRLDRYITDGSNQHEIAGLVREDTVTKKVFFIRCQYLGPGEWCDTMEVLIYDFSKSPGDTINVGRPEDGYHYTFVLDSIIVDSTISTNRIHKIHSVLWPYYYQMLWIEGVGSLTGLLYNSYPLRPYSPYALVCAFKDSAKTAVNPQFITYYGDTCIVITVGIEETSSTSLKIFPNPAIDRLQVLLTNPSGQQSKIQEIYLTDIRGVTVLQTQQTDFSISGIAKGMYFVHVQLADREFVRKVIIN